MTGAETASDSMDRNDETAQDLSLDPAPVSLPQTGDTSPRPSPQSGEGEETESPFRPRIRERVRVLKSLRNPTVEQIERRQFWEEYLERTKALAPRALQEPAVEPVQRR